MSFPYHDKDLAQLPAPSVLEQFDYESLLERRKQTLNALYPLVFENGQPALKPAELIQTETESYWKIPLNGDAGLYYLDLESDPATRLLQADTYHEQYIRQRINEAALSTMPAYAKGSDLDHIGARKIYDTPRLIITPATDTTPAVMESDEAYRRRLLLSVEGKARGGSPGWYLYHSLSAHGQVKDAYVYSPSPCKITIVVLQHDGIGTASGELIDTVYQYVTSRYKFPQGDRVTVISAEVLEYEASARLMLYPGPSSEAILNAIKAAWETYRAQSERIGHIIGQSAVNAALHQPGVYRALVDSPNLPMAVTRHQAPFCTKLTLTEVDDVV